MKTQILIENLRFLTIVGVYDWEQATPQPLVVNVCLDCDMTKAFVSDCVDDVINYKAVCEEIEAICHHTKAHLLEHLAHKILSHLFGHYPCTHIHLSLKKPSAIKHAQAVGVAVSVYRDEFLNELS